MFSCQIKVRTCSSVFSSNESRVHRKSIKHSIEIREWKRNQRETEKSLKRTKENVLCCFHFLYISVSCIQYIVSEKVLFLIMHVFFMTVFFFSFSNKKFNQKIIFQARFDGKSLERLRGLGGESKRENNSQAWVNVCSKFLLQSKLKQRGMTLWNSKFYCWKRLKLKVFGFLKLKIFQTTKWDKR